MLRRATLLKKVTHEMFTVNLVNFLRISNYTVTVITMSLALSLKKNFTDIVSCIFKTQYTKKLFHITKVNVNWPLIKCCFTQFAKEILKGKLFCPLFCPLLYTFMNYF